MSRSLVTRRTWLLAILLIVVLAAALLLRRTERPPTSEGASEAALRSLPYLTWVAAEEGEEKRGVTLHDRERAHPGLNLYAPRESHRAFLLDMEGEVLHRWEAFVDEAETWQLIEPMDDGSLLVIAPNRRLLRIDRDSNVAWTLDERVHHDLSVARSGEIYVLAREELEVERGGRTWPVLDDLILRVSADGEVLGRMGLYDLFAARVPENRWPLLDQWLRSDAGRAEIAKSVETTGFRLPNGSPADLFHTNSIEILESDLPGVAPAGALLISIRELSLVAIVDFDEPRVHWSWGPGIIHRQHHPSRLENDNILIFDNLGGAQRTSRIVEVDPRSGDIVWEFAGDPPPSFHSALRGGSQRLANGNTLATESDRGRVFEVTPEGELVWEFYNPVLRSGGLERSSIYRMMRLEPEAAAWLD